MHAQVLGDQAVVDPSKVEALVMGQVARRKNEHEARNQAAKLTPQEKRDKKKRKLLEDTSKEMQVWTCDGVTCGCCCSMVCVCVCVIKVLTTAVSYLFSFSMLRFLRCSAFGKRGGINVYISVGVRLHFFFFFGRQRISGARMQA